MKKLLVLLILGVVLSGCSLLPQKSSESEMPALGQQAVKEYQKVAEAMASGKSVECVMTNAQEGTSFTYQVKGKMIRSFGQLSPDSTSSGNMISDGSYLYMWSDDSAQGTKMKILSEAEAAEITEQPEDVLPDLSDEVKQQELVDLGYSIRCDEKNLADDAFVPPATIQFQDLSQMMEAANQIQQKMAPSIEGESPEMTQEQLELMMKSFGDGE